MGLLRKLKFKPSQYARRAKLKTARDRPKITVEIDDPAYSTVRARQDKIFDIFAYVEDWLKDKTKFEAIEILRKHDIPCGPVLSMKKIANDPSLRKSGTTVEL